MKVRNFFLIVSLFGIFIQPPQPAPKSMQNASPDISAIIQAWRIYTNVKSIYALTIQGNYLWAGSDGAVVRWNTTDGSYILFTTDDGLAGNVINAIASDQAGNLWFGTGYECSYEGQCDGRGVSKFDGVTWTTYTTMDGLADNSIGAITSDADGNLWFGTIGGVSELYFIRSLSANYARCAAGSFFNLASDHFPANQSTPVSVNGTQLGDIPISANGVFTFTLSTANAGQGIYFVKVGERPALQLRLRLDAQQPIRPKEGDYTVIDIPSGIALTPRFYLPTLRR